MSHILLVDDDEDMLKLTQRWLMKAGYEVSTALSGKEAINCLANGKTDLILLDYAMPQMDGCETFQAIRENEAFQKIPIVFRTGNDDEGAVDLMERLKPDGVVPKAEGKPYLLQVVAGILK